MLYYIGDGARFPGVPTRDLTKEEVEELAPQLIEVMLAHKLYARSRPATAQASPAAKAASVGEPVEPAEGKDAKP